MNNNPTALERLWNRLKFLLTGEYSEGSYARGYADGMRQRFADYVGDDGFKISFDVKAKKCPNSHFIGMAIDEHTSGCYKVEFDGQAIISRTEGVLIDEALLDKKT